MRAVAALLLVPAFAAAVRAQNPATDPAPVISGSGPAVLMVRSANVPVRLEITGRNFWPSGPNDPARWRTYLRAPGGSWREYRLSSIANTGATFSFDARDYLQKPGRLEVQYSRDGVRSNVYSIEVRAAAPKLSSIMPEQIALRSGMTEGQFNIIIRGSDWVFPTTLYIDGKPQGRLQGLDYGVDDHVLPAALRTPGRHRYQVETEHGRSAEKYLEIVAAPTSLSVVEPTIRPAALRAPNTTLVTYVRFQGSEPTQVAYRTDLTPLREASFRTNIRGDEATVTIPVGPLGGAAWIDVRLKNAAGEATTRITVDRTQLTAGAELPSRAGTVTGGAGQTARTPVGTGVVQPPPVTVPALPGGTPVSRPGARPMPAAGARPGATTATAPATTPVAAPPTSAGTGIIVQGGRPTPPTTATTPPAGIIVQGGRTATPGGIAAPGPRPPVDAVRANLQSRLGPATASRVTATLQGTTLVLTGTVPTEAAKQQAAQAAAGVAGITAVRNDLRVAP